MGEAVYELSPSQLELFDDEDGREGCNLKWAYNYVFNKSRPASNETAELGKRCHKVLENYLEHDYELCPDDIEEDRIVMAGLHHFPRPGSGVMAERDFQLQHYNHYFVGTKDAEWRKRKSGLWIADLKTTKDFKWALTEEQLRTGYQGPLYAAEALYRTGDKHVNLKWVYVRTKGAPKSKVVTTTFTPKQLNAPLDRVKRTSDRLIQIRRKAKETGDPASIPANVEVCDAYGGCPHKEYCPARTGTNRLRSVMARGTKQFIADVAARVNPPKPKPVKINGKWVTPEPPPEEPKKGKKKAAEDMPIKSSTAKKKPVEEEEDEEEVEETPAPKKAKKAAPVVEEEDEDEEVEEAPKAKKKAAPVVEEEEEEEDDEEEAPAPKKRGRPKGSKNKGAAVTLPGQIEVTPPMKKIANLLRTIADIFEKELE